MTLQILDEAAHEFAESAAYYETKVAELGTRFKDEVASVIEWISLNPLIPRMRAKGYRRVNLRVFPHYVAYVIRGETIWVVAVAHGHRRPEFWIKRL